MANLQALFQLIAQATDERVVRLQISAASSYFAAQRGGLFFFDQIPLADARFQPILRVALSVEHNPTPCSERSPNSERQMLKRDSGRDGKADRLTPRELEIAELVAQGRTNAEVGAALWITENSVKQALKRMFRKLEVSSRTEMVTVLALDPNHAALDKDMKLAFQPIDADDSPHGNKHQ